MDARPSQATQDLTQPLVDPRRTGDDFSDLGSSDVADIVCILHPCSAAALDIASRTAATAPQHVLQSDEIQRYDDDLRTSDLDPQQTLILPELRPKMSLDLALRFSSPVRSPAHGFLFGRNANNCDFVVNADIRVSNVHFRIFLNESGVLMLHDNSTNGTLVDDVRLQSKDRIQTRMLKSGSVIQILSMKPADNVKFIVRIPSRNGFELEYESNFRSYYERVVIAGEQYMRHCHPHPPKLPVCVRTNPAAKPNRMVSSARQALIKKDWGMHWHGGNKYNVVGHLGQGAFATVYQVATKVDGTLYAAKELEKRKFMKNGVLDRKLDNELQIMKDLSHPNIVQFIEYYDYDKHVYIIMEFVGCGNLEQYIVRNGPLPERIARPMAAQVLVALTYLHTKRVTHRDIKPDNILIANDDPDDFLVKLSDFGLSKVVKDDFTFLKTFCGTLLYCAPEVFPHYDAHVAAHGGLKRPRRTAASNQKTYHSYSQSVDIWSFGAVLWYSLCGKTPFQGVMDTNGRGMFDRIMKTPLDLTPLRRSGVPTIVIELLFNMLTTDPSERPTPHQCLQHPWLAGLSNVTRECTDDDKLGAIEETGEEEEEGEDEDEDEDACEPDLSQLRIHEAVPDDIFGQAFLDSADLDFLDPRESKRFKYHDSNDQGSQLSKGPVPNGHRVGADNRPARSMLFGEVTESLLNAQARAQKHVERNHEKENSAFSSEHDIYHLWSAEKQGVASTDRATTHPVSGPPHKTSLSGAESMVRDLNMDSPHSAVSLQAHSDEPRTPGSPDEARDNSKGGGTQETPTKEQEATPRSVPFNRQMELEFPASLYYDPNDPSTHNAEYASMRSGHDFTANPVCASSFATLDRVPERATATYKQCANDNEKTHQDQATDSAQEVPAETTSIPVRSEASFARPAPRLGQLVTTSGSFDDIKISLTDRFTVWGRGHGYPWPYDTRVPKSAIAIQFNSSRYLEAVQKGEDWTKLPDLACWISTLSNFGIWVNGSKLRQKDEKGRRLCGKLYHGDIVTIVKPKNDRPQDGELSFKVEIFHGICKVGRRSDERFKEIVDKTQDGLVGKR